MVTQIIVEKNGDCIDYIERAKCILCEKIEELSFFELLENIDPETRKNTYICDDCKYKITIDDKDYTSDFEPSIHKITEYLQNEFSVEELKKKVRQFNDKSNEKMA